jgi:hypothetical protein
MSERDDDPAVQDDAHSEDAEYADAAERGNAATEPLVTRDWPAWDWPGREASPRRDPFRSLSRRLLDDLHKPRPIRSRDLIILLPGLLIGVLLVSLLVIAVTPALSSALFARFTGIPQRRSVSNVAIVPTTTASSIAPTATSAHPPTATPLPAAEAVYVSRDAKTQGNWPGVYGQSGAVVIGGSQRLPPGVQLAPSNAGLYSWSTATNDARALQQDATGSNRVAACWYNAGTFSVAVTIPQGQRDRLALYFLDWDRLQRAEDIRLLDGATGKLLDTRSVSTFDGGVYLVWRVRGRITIQIVNHSGAVNAVLSGLFFSPA